MVLARFLVILYGCTLVSAAMIPPIDKTSLEQTTVPKARISTAPSVPIAVRQNSIDDELNAMDDLDADIFIITVADRQFPQHRYKEYVLQQGLMACNQRYGSDPALISDQSSIGNTPLTDVRYFQCTQALVTCAQKAIQNQKSASGSWPPPDPLERPVLRTDMIEQGTSKCLRQAAADHERVFASYMMPEAEFEIFGTVGICNENLIVCFEDVLADYAEVVFTFDDNHPQ